MPNHKNKSSKDRRRKHDHFRVTITYVDNEISGRVFIDRAKAEAYCKRQEKSPVVKKTRVEQIT